MLQVNLTREEILEYLKQNKLRFSKLFYVDTIGLFGSFSRCEQNENSDIDILVELKPGTPDIYRAKKKLQQDISEHFNRKVDIASRKYLKPYASQDILKETIYA